MKTDTIVLVAALGIGGYFIYNYLSNNSLAKAAGTVGNTLNYINTPIVAGQTSGVGAITPAQLLIPITTLPNIATTLIQPIGGTKPIAKETPSYGSFLFPPLGIFEAVTKIPNLIGETKKMFGW